MGKKPIYMEIWTLICISLGGILLHYRIHPPAQNASNWVPLLLGLITCVILPFMFCCPKGAKWAYLINLATVVIGIIMMTHYSIEAFAKMEGSITLNMMIFQSTLADNIILLAKLFPAQRILQYYKRETQADCKIL